ncbi:ORF45 [Retroperitoneal fibromatosis-associated herpesvirus]|uniref:ORF45 n=1 Tax=Retroperitoneal fibromatosis-associated herpesvirus TaxID=111469 RepID=U5NIW9_9GAMA|nr:ORF45 [Retroperitoneal fibromatosis-associated herpesvirus]AGY30726.1 ORF45 [Retroperitoneal fibromatosis-associated herpesvirus]
MAMFLDDSPPPMDDDRLFPYEGAPRRVPPRRFIFPPPRPVQPYGGPPVIDLSAPDDVFAEDDTSPPATPLDLLPSPGPADDRALGINAHHPGAGDWMPAALPPPLAGDRGRPLASTVRRTVPVAVVTGHVRSPLRSETVSSDSFPDWESEGEGFSPGESFSDGETTDTFLSESSVTRDSTSEGAHLEMDPDEGPSWRPLRAEVVATIDLLSDSDSESPTEGTHGHSSEETLSADEGPSTAVAQVRETVIKRKRQSTASSASEASGRPSRRRLWSSGHTSIIIISSDSDSEPEPTQRSSFGPPTGQADAAQRLPENLDDESTSATSLSSRSSDSSSGDGDASRALTSTPPLSGNGNYNWPWLD